MKEKKVKWLPVCEIKFHVDINIYLTKQDPVYNCYDKTKIIEYIIFLWFLSVLLFTS